MDLLDPLISVVGGPSDSGNPYLFTGRRYDSETGWYHYRACYLDPLSGRFTTRDPIGIWGSLRNLGNGYTYAGNNPSSLLDPLGLQERPPPITPDQMEDILTVSGIGWGLAAAGMGLAAVTAPIWAGPAAVAGLLAVVSFAGAYANGKMAKEWCHVKVTKSNCKNAKQYAKDTLWCIKCDKKCPVGKKTTFKNIWDVPMGADDVTHPKPDSPKCEVTFLYQTTSCSKCGEGRGTIFGQAPEPCK